MGETVENGITNENFTRDATVDDEADCLRESEGAVPHGEDERVPEGDTGEVGEEDVVEDLNGRDEHGLVEGVENDESCSHVAHMTMNKKKSGEIFEVDDGEVGSTSCLLSFTT